MTCASWRSTYVYSAFNSAFMVQWAKDQAETASSFLCLANPWKQGVNRLYDIILVDPRRNWNDTLRYCTNSTTKVFWRFMKGKFNPYVLWPLAQKFQNGIVDQTTNWDFTVNILGKQIGISILTYLYLGCNLRF